MCLGEEAVVLGTEKLWQIFLFVIVQIPIFITVIISLSQYVTMCALVIVM